MKNLSKTYDPKSFEDRIYKEWEEKGAFSASPDPARTPYAIVMPPPNITGQLHMGHALDHILQDILIRWKRMSGYETLWLPGSDHASIATEVRVADRLRERGLDKESLGREEFLKEAWKWKEEFGGVISRQCRKLGDSCDWSRERFTMDEGCNRAVRHTFVRLYEKGLIYKGNRLINWCPDCGTTLSDAEVEHEDRSGKYWYFRYPAEDGGEGIVVATSRPETMFGDVAIAVNPNDERYSDMIGKNVLLPILDRKIPVIADPYPDPEKGTGAVKITPAHDFNDFEVGERHNLEIISCLDKNAKMNEQAGKYAGMDRYECRRAWVEELDAAGYLVKQEDITIPVGCCYRCDTAVEPMISDQWFVAMEELAKPAIEAAKNGSLTHVPERFEKIYLSWLENIRDWCISRQLWWGHRIPAYYCDDCEKIIVSEETPLKCTCGGSLRQDEDVLDTWFSSALWPFSTLGWPDKTEDFDYFYPTSVLVTGYDILFFWVVRMVFSALELTEEVPFSHVYLHGLVRAADGQKMSKSLDNGIDPLKVIDEMGADALRFMLATGITPGNDMRFKDDKLEAARNFANKLWNASRFVIMNLYDNGDNLLDVADESVFSDGRLALEDKWILSRVNSLAEYCKKALERFDLSLAGLKAYDVIWNEYCDWYIEFVKPRLYGDDEEDKAVARYVLVRVLKDLLKLLQPFMPFITEEIWNALPKNNEDERNKLKGIDFEYSGFLMWQKWPEYDSALKYDEDAGSVELAMEVIKSIRNIRAEADAQPGRRLGVLIVAEPEIREIIDATKKHIMNLAGLDSLEYADDKSSMQGEMMSAVIDGAEIFVPLGDLIDFEVELERLKKEKSRLESEVARVNGMLANPNFVDKAPAEKVQAEKDKKQKYEDMLAKVMSRLVSLGSK